MKHLGRCLLVLLIVFGSISMVWASEEQNMKLPTPTGNYGVGTIALPLVDQTRPGKYDYGKTSPFRELMTQIWYPAEKEATSPKGLVPYMDDRTMECMANDYAVLSNVVKSVKTNAVSEAPAVRGYFPVLIFSPGLWGVCSGYQTILEDLASHGYIVVAVNHPNVSGITVFPDGHYYSAKKLESPSIEEYIQYCENHFREVVEDLKFVTYQLGYLNTNQSLPIAGRMDLRRIACFGHSYGGAAAVQACIEKPELATAVDIDGSLWGECYKKPINKPMLLLNNDTHNVIEDPKLNDIWKNLHQGSYMIEVDETRHNSFTDLTTMCSLLPQTPDIQELITKSFGLLDSARSLEITRYCIRTFFDCNLKDQSHDLMKRLDEKFNEVWLKVKRP